MIRLYHIIIIIIIIIFSHNKDISSIFYSRFKNECPKTVTEIIYLKDVCMCACMYVCMYVCIRAYFYAISSFPQGHIGWCNEQQDWLVNITGHLIFSALCHIKAKCSVNYYLPSTATHLRNSGGLTNTRCLRLFSWEASNKKVFYLSFSS